MVKYCRTVLGATFRCLQKLYRCIPRMHLVSKMKTKLEICGGIGKMLNVHGLSKASDIDESEIYNTLKTNVS